MNWVMTLAMLLQKEPPSLEDLSLALFARGRCAIETRGALAEDAKLLRLESAFLRVAALQPAPDVLLRRLRQAEDALHDVDDTLALQAERALADVLNHRDRWHVRALALRALGFDSLAHSVESEVSRMDERIQRSKGSLAAISWMRDEALLSAWDPANSAWSLVPPCVEALPEHHPGLPDTLPIRDEDILQVAQGLADPILEHRVLQAMEKDETLRKRYEALMEDFEVFQEAPRNVVHLFVKRHLAHVPKAHRLDIRAAAATTPSCRYETPGVDALVYTFQDDSELYAQHEGAQWVLFLSREHPDTRDGFRGPLVESLKQGHLLIAVTRPGVVQVHYGESLVQLTLEPLEP